MPISDLNFVKTSHAERILGVAFPMKNGVGGYVSQNENLRSLRDCVMQLILTNRGSRVMRPDYGTDLRASVFEPLTGDMISALREQILEVISKYEPRVIVKKVELIPNFERNELKVQLFITSKDDLLNGELVEVLV